jgi:hypothetical protein
MPIRYQITSSQPDIPRAQHKWLPPKWFRATRIY